MTDFRTPLIEALQQRYSSDHEERISLPDSEPRLNSEAVTSIPSTPESRTSQIEMLRQPTSSAEIELDSLPALTNQDHDNNLHDAPNIPQRKTAMKRMGTRVLVVLAVTLVLELAVMSFIAFLWTSPRDNVFWHWLAINGWLTSAVTASSLVLRTAVDLQAGIAVTMLAALMLETNFPLLLRDAAHMSQLRATSGNPFDLVIPYLGSMGLVKKCALVKKADFVVIPLLATTTLLLQLTSAVLVSDLSIGTLPGMRRHESPAYDLKYTYNESTESWSTFQPTILQSTWQSSPLAFPAFGEFQEAISVPENVDDTGRLFRAFLPFPDSSSRQMLSY